MRAILVILDSFGIGGAPDADKFGDAGANTLGHIRAACATGGVSDERPNAGPLNLPNMAAMGLYHALACANDGEVNDGPDLQGSWAAATEQGAGKDTPSGHWEITGFPVTDPPAVFANKTNSFPQDLLDQIANAADVPGFLGNKHASGIALVEDLAQDHLQTGKPILYTSVDSVLQIAAHEEAFGLERLLDLCRIARPICDAYNIGRVIARPFTGDAATGFTRTGNRRDFTMPPKGRTLLDDLHDAGRQVLAMGKIGDIYAHRGITQTRKAHGNMALFDLTLSALDDLQEGGLLFANFVDFDTIYGHGRNPLGYAAALEAFDARLPELFATLRVGDMLILSADHGNDPTWRGTDHTRERVPVLIRGTGTTGLGVRNMADIGASIAVHLGVPSTGTGQSFLSDIERLT